MRAKERKTILLICLLVTGLLQSQTVKNFIQGPSEGQVICGSDILHQRLLIEDTGYRQRHENQSEVLRQSIALHQGAQDRMTVYTIPVVVHIMHTGQAVGSGINISDEQVQSAIDGLNEDYRKMPGTLGDGDGVDVEMEFCLASRDPDGNPTNGINRIDASSVPLYADEGISIGQGNGASETAVKSLSRWNRDDYYNIWIVSEIENNDGGAGIQGFAYFPTSSASKDGAVILYNAFGTVGTLKSYTSLNRTASHELGHAFYLYHTFQGNSCSETNCITQGDQVCDTPPTVSSTSCASPACGGTQLVENYMDYTHQTCMNMFTQGQKDRMRNALLTMRSGLINSMGCTPPNDLDAGITNITEPSGFSCATSFAPQVELKNFGSNTLTSVQIEYRVDAGAEQTYDYSGVLLSGESEMIDLPQITVGAGAHSFEAYTNAPNGGTDGFQSNDDFSTDFEVVSGSMVTVAIDVDNYGNETTWDITDSGGNTVASGGPYPSNAYGTTFESVVCLADDCYDFTIYDSYGDGICCGYGFGGYLVTDDTGTVLAESGVDFTDFETTSYCLSGSGGGSDEPPVADFSASNTLTCVGSTIQFTDLSSGSPDTWNWSFPGGSPTSSTSQNPTVTYNSAGSKTITLTVSNAFGSDTEVRTGYIIIGDSPTLSTTSTDASCYNSSNGTLDLSVSGGTSPFSYAWSNGSVTQDLAGLGAGVYSVVVTDYAGCTSNTAALIQSPDQIDLSNTSSTDASCANDGSASVSPADGSPGYTYLWNDPSQQTTATATDLAQGTYTVIVTDSEGCQASTSVTVAGGGDMDLSNGSKTAITCHGNNDGTATVNPIGGVTPYAYLWDNGQTTATATSLSGGTHLVTVTDAGGCQSSRTFYIQEPDVLNVNVIAVEDESCAGMDDGSISAEIFGGTEPYSFHWNGAGLGPTLNPQGMSAGDYQLSVTDENSCATDQGFTLSEGEAVQIFMSGTNETCHDTDDGSILVDLQGGTQPYTYNWNGAGLGQTLNPQGVSAGSYTFNVTDADGCESTDEIMITEPAAIQSTLVSISPDSCDLNVGKAEISVSGGTGQKSIQWDDSENQTGTILEDVRFGVYTAAITDEHQCQAFHTLTIEDLNCDVTGIEELIHGELKIFPNPVSGEELNIDLGQERITELSITLIDITGKAVQNWSLNSAEGLQTLRLGQNCSEGLYMLQLTDGAQVLTQKIIIR